jgi:hypothetical protein
MQMCTFTRSQTIRKIKPPEVAILSALTANLPDLRSQAWPIILPQHLNLIGFPVFRAELSFATLWLAAQPFLRDDRP